VARQHLEECEEALSRISHELIDGFIGRGEVELRSEFADPLALFTICKLAGFPAEDRPIYMSWNRIGTGHGRRYLTRRVPAGPPPNVTACRTPLPRGR
jgi:cytochrome P450